MLVERAERLNFRDDEHPVAVRVEVRVLGDLGVDEGAHGLDARGVADERRGHKVDAVGDAERDVGLVLVAQRRQPERRAGDVDALALADGVAVRHRARDAARVRGRDLEDDEAGAVEPATSAHAV